MAIWLSVCEREIYQFESPALGMIEVIRDDCNDNISISLNMLQSYYVEYEEWASKPTCMG